MRQPALAGVQKQTREQNWQRPHQHHVQSEGRPSRDAESGSDRHHRARANERELPLEHEAHQRHSQQMKAQSLLNTAAHHPDQAQGDDSTEEDVLRFVIPDLPPGRTDQRRQHQQQVQQCAAPEIGFR